MSFLLRFSIFSFVIYTNWTFWHWTFLISPHYIDSRLTRRIVWQQNTKVDTKANNIITCLPKKKTVSIFFLGSKFNLFSSGLRLDFEIQKNNQFIVSFFLWWVWKKHQKFDKKWREANLIWCNFFENRVSSTPRHWYHCICDFWPEFMSIWLF